MSRKPIRKPISLKERFAVLQRDRFTCQYCGQKAPSVVLHVDHMRPASDGGSNDRSNLVTACSACNQGKSTTPAALLWEELERLWDVARKLAPCLEAGREDPWRREMTEDVFIAFDAFGCTEVLFVAAGAPGITWEQWRSYCIRHFHEWTGIWDSGDRKLGGDASLDRTMEAWYAWNRGESEVG